ncbi:MAG TPA: 1-acyl-sn-glycerol-3-phosphate acyltransferase [Thermotogaceae bacterium]|nr:1-acyl-sn-glycerol-3-phosphate acyltransferase [Thermotogaceae bacterium]
MFILKMILGNLIFIFGFIAYVVYGYIVIIRMRIKRKKYGVKKMLEYAAPRIKNFSIRAFKWTFVDVEVEGMENIPKDSNFLIIANHQSLLDIPLLLAYIDPTLAFIAKKEVSKIPMIGSFVKEMGGVLLDRSDIKKAVAALMEVMKGLREGRSFVLFPEGTRSADGNLREFRKGSLKIALRTKVKILPVVIDGTINVTPKGSIFIRPNKVKLKILEPLDPSKFENEESLRGFLEKSFKDQLLLMRGGVYNEKSKNKSASC